MILSDNTCATNASIVYHCLSSEMWLLGDVFLIINNQQATLMAELPYYLRLFCGLWLEGGDSL